MDKNTEHVKQIAETIEALATGEKVICEHCGELVENDETCSECGNEMDGEGLHDYLADVLDF